MKILSWNCQGMGSRLTVSFLREIWNNNRPDIVFLSETKQDLSFMQKFQGHFGYNNIFTVEPCGYSGGMTLLFNNDLNAHIIFSNNRIIDVEAFYKKRKIFLTFIYGDPVVKNRDYVWEKLSRIGIVRSEPWFMIGDFNEITGNNEKQGGSLRPATSFIPFNNMISNCGMQDLPSFGNKLSWRGKRGNKIVRCRLDRAMGNIEWLDMFSHTMVKYLPMVGSDHRPLLATIRNGVQKHYGLFRFDKRWIGKEGLYEAIENGWKDTYRDNNMNFVDKVTKCRASISRWKKDLVPFDRGKINNLKNTLEEIQDKDGETQQDIITVTKELKEAYKEEELFWKQKSRNLWLREGDQNSKFFHAVTKQRRARNRIIGLEDNNGIWEEDDCRVENIAVEYFSDMFSSSNPIGCEEILREINVVITDDMNARLTRPALEEEIKETLFQMHPEKAPGPDGMTALFFQEAWVTIKGDLVKLVNEFFTNGSFDERLNMTNICLIPKSKDPKIMTDFRPISLCNVGYKIISKLLCQRLKNVLPKIISETQSAFVAGRLISDNILIAQEMFHGLRTNNSCKGQFMAIKTDMSKAYDRVEWSFLEKLLFKLGFHGKWISWIMFCITSVTYRVLLNGQPKGQIKPKRGLRQGDPLSSYLFILCTEVLVESIKKAEREKRLNGIKVARSSPPITHLLFADDSLFFCKANITQCTVIKEVLRKYGLASGQQINFAKSSVTFGHLIPEGEREVLKETLGISKEGGMGSYLGLPESLGGAKSKIFAFVQERLQERINGWTTKFLSKGGKEILIKSVALALPTYVMSCYRLPKNITSKLTSAIARFWWSTGGNKKGLHWLSWSKVCRSKSDGGLGFRTIDEFNTALLAKQLWRLIQFPESLLARVLKGRYYHQSNPMIDKRYYSPSYGWRSIISARFILEHGLIKKVGTGETISAWRDHWIQDEWPRPAKYLNLNYPPNLMVNHMIDPRTNDWNVNLLNAFFDPNDIPIIRAMPVSKHKEKDKLIWAFTKSGKYTVKSGYWVAHKKGNTSSNTTYLGPNVNPLLSKVWNTHCPFKIQHFLWQVISGCLAVNSRLKSRGIPCDLICQRCGDDEESINHALFTCPPALQTWALSDIPSGPNYFPLSSHWENMDYLFRIMENAQKNEENNYFPWILWFIWKARNDHVHNGTSRNPPDIIKHAISEAIVWCEAQNKNDDKEEDTEILSIPITSKICQIDGSWKGDNLFAGLGWCGINTNGTIFLVGAKGHRRSMSPLHAELEALLWAMECMLEQQEVSITFQTDCRELIKMTYNPTEWPSFDIQLQEFRRLKNNFGFFKLIYLPRTSNGKADCLARSARIRSLNFSYVNSVIPSWITKPFV